MSTEDITFTSQAAAFPLYSIFDSIANGVVVHDTADGSDNDGRGLPEDFAGDGLGLRIMRYRTQPLGGTFSIQSSPGARTTVQREVSIDEEENG